MEDGTMERGFGFGFDASEAWWGWKRGPRRGRRGRRVWFGSGDMKYVILKLLREKAMHGYEVMKALEEQTRGCYKPSPGTVYPTLQMLEDEGLVLGKEENGKKIYEITDDGTAFLEENKSTVDEIFERVEDMIETFFTDPMPDVSRLVGKLVSQAYRKTWRFREDDEKRASIRSILERAIEDLEEVGAEAVTE
jgi:DNA-binding PadR family transcriptional regulator